MSPTHYAVALKYERSMQAPVCLAKGLDHLALKIRDIALDANMSVVQNPPLAPILYSSVEMRSRNPGSSV